VLGGGWGFGVGVAYMRTHFKVIRQETKPRRKDKERRPTTKMTGSFALSSENRGRGGSTREMGKGGQ